MAKKKSLLSKIEERILHFTKPSYMTSQSEIEEFINKKLKENEKQVRSIGESFNYEGMQVISIGNKDSEKVVLYMHGGAYINQLSLQHTLFAYFLSRNLDVQILLPVYPLTPKHTYMETYTLIESLYKNLLKDDKKVILMGDSAGGGFVLSFCQYLNKNNISLPRLLIGFSPWVDISMSGVYENEDNDPVLGKIGLKMIGEKWAGNLNTNDYRVSPLYGDNTNFPRTLIFTGTNEIFYEDIKKYINNLKNDNVDVNFIKGEGLFHVYPLFPLPESRDVIKILKNEINLI